MPAILFFHSPILQHFWRWWQRQLLSLVPERLRGMFRRQSGYYLAIADDKRAQLWRQDSGGKLLKLTPIPLAALENWRKTIDPSITLLLLSGQYLRRCIVLPAAARENLPRIIAFELDRHTPFNASQAYFSARILGPAPQTGQIKVEFVVTPRALLNDLLSPLHKAGLFPHRVTLLAEPEGRPQPDFDLLPPHWRPHSQHWVKILNLGLSGLLLLLMALAMALPVLSQGKVIHLLENRIRQARTEARQANELKQKVVTLERQIHFVLDRKGAHPPLITLLEELSLRLPQDTWLTGLRYQDHQVHIDGKSPTASKLVELLEDSPYLQNVHFISPVTQDRSGLERFRISMDVNHDAKADPAD